MSVKTGYEFSLKEQTNSILVKEKYHLSFLKPKTRETNRFYVKFFKKTFLIFFYGIGVIRGS